MNIECLFQMKLYPTFNQIHPMFMLCVLINVGVWPAAKVLLVTCLRTNLLGGAAIDESGCSQRE